MQLIAIGGDLRMNGFLRAARRAGLVCECVKTKEALEALDDHAEAIALPWPRSFSGEQVFNTDISRDALLEKLPSCSFLMGGGFKEQDFPQAQRLIDPSKDEEMLTVNAKLTAEGAAAALLSGREGAILGKTCLITGFGRIARALAQRLTAMEMFVIVCARNEQQMQLAHRMGAHPVPLDKLADAAAQADVVINTIPARIFGADALCRMKSGARYIELASAPYGADPEQAARLGVSMEVMSGIPGKYAPEQAGEALFDAFARAMNAGKAKKEAL